MKSIQSKILSVIIAAMLILGVAISLISVAYINTVLKNDSDIITETVANTEALRINDLLRKTTAKVQIMENYVHSTLLEPERLSDEAYRATYTQNAKKALFAVAEGAETSVAFYLRFAPELTSATAGFFISRESGGKQFSEKTPTDLTDWENAPKEKVCWYSEPLKAEKAVWLLPYCKPSSDVKMVSYVIPVYIDGSFVGVVGMDMEFETLTQMVDSISVYDNGFAYLSDSEENIFYSAADEHTLNRAHTNHGFAEEIRTLDNRMNLVIHADYSDIQSDAYRMVLLIIVIVLLIMAAFIFLTYLITRKIVRPVKQITEAAESLADGNTELKLDSCNTGDEIEVLATSMKKTSEKLRGYMSYINALAYRDALTGVKNRTAYNEAAANMNVKMGSNKNISYAVLVADINKLKSANDKYGHDAGNQLIIKASKIICDIFKHSPVFRFGGDEFIVILENEDFEKREELVRLMDERCAESSVAVTGGTIGVSIARGLEAYTPAIHESFEDVFSRADRKMYENKKSKSESKNT